MDKDNKIYKYCYHLTFSKQEKMFKNLHPCTLAVEKIRFMVVEN